MSVVVLVNECSDTQLTRWQQSKKHHFFLGESIRKYLERTTTTGVKNLGQKSGQKRGVVVVF